MMLFLWGSRQCSQRKRVDSSEGSIRSRKLEYNSLVIQNNVPQPPQFVLLNISCVPIRDYNQLGDRSSGLACAGQPILEDAIANRARSYRIIRKSP